MKAEEMKQLSQDSVRDEINDLVESMKEAAQNGHTSMTPSDLISEGAKSWLVDNGYCIDAIDVALGRIVRVITWD